MPNNFKPTLANVLQSEDSINCAYLSNTISTSVENAKNYLRGAVNDDRSTTQHIINECKTFIMLAEDQRKLDQAINAIVKIAQRHGALSAINDRE